MAFGSVADEPAAVVDIASHFVMNSRETVLAFLILSVCFVELIEAKFYSTALAGERLLRDLSVNYDPVARPAVDDGRTDVNVSIELQHFDFREPDGVFTLTGILYARWHDPKLGWNPKDYNNLLKIPVKTPAKVWIPDLEFYNNAPNKFMNMHEGYRVVLEHNGNVLWSNTIVITVFCTAEMRDWPHDRHVCKLALGSWTYDGLEVDINYVEENGSMNFDELNTQQNMEYRVTSFHAEHVLTVYSCCAEPYVSIDYHISFERRSAFVVIFRALALCVILLTLLALSMKPWRSEKLWLNGISFIVIVLNLLYFARNLGGFTRHTPLIVVFHSCSLILVTFAQLIAVFSLMATRSPLKGKLPWRISRILQSSWFAYIALPEKAPRNALHDIEPVDLNSQFEDVLLQEYSNLICANGDPNGNEWLQLATALERVTLLVFALIFLILSSACFV